MTGTLAGADAFWVERVRKEVKTQMAHQEYFEQVNPLNQINFYEHMGENAVDQAPAHSQTRYRNASAIGKAKFAEKKSAGGKFGTRRSSTPNNFPEQGKGSSLQSAKNQQLYEKLLAKKRNERYGDGAKSLSSCSSGRYKEAAEAAVAEYEEQFNNGGDQSATALESHRSRNSNGVQKSFTAGRDAKKRSSTKVCSKAKQLARKNRSSHVRTLSQVDGASSVTASNNDLKRQKMQSLKHGECDGKQTKTSLKAFKDHILPEAQSMTSSQTLITSAKGHERLARVELTQLLQHRLRKLNLEDSKPTASVFNNHRARLQQQASQAETASVYTGDEPKAERRRMKVRSNFLRQLQSQAIYEDHDDAYENEGAASAIRKVDSRCEVSTRGFSGHWKGKKPARFNEKVETQSRGSLPLNKYLNQSHGRNAKQPKVNLRSINNFAEREFVRKMQENRQSKLQLRPVTVQDQVPRHDVMSLKSRTSIPTSKLSRQKNLERLQSEHSQQQHERNSRASSYKQMTAIESYFQKYGDDQKTRKLAAASSQLRLKARLDQAKRMDEMHVYDQLGSSEFDLPQQVADDPDFCNEYGLPADENQAQPDEYAEEVTYRSGRGAPDSSHIEKGYLNFKGNQKEVRALPEDQTTQCSIQASMLSRSQALVQEGHANAVGSQRRQSCESISRSTMQIDQNSAFEGKSSISQIPTQQLNHLQKKLCSERAKRKEMERQLASLIKMSSQINQKISQSRLPQQEDLMARKSASMMNGLAAKRVMVKHADGGQMKRTQTVTSNHSQSRK